MVAPSYEGETVTGVCPACGHVAELPVWAREGEYEGYCPGSGSAACGVVQWKVWDAPVSPI